MTDRGRLSYIDSLRGFAMLLVVLQHYEFPYVGKYILSFHMPLFFAISGYLFRYSGAGEKRFTELVKNKAMQLLIPYCGFELIFLIISYCMMPIFHNKITFYPAVISILLCIDINKYSGIGTNTGISPRLWFLPCMFVSYIAMYGIYKLMKNGKNVHFYCAFILLVIISRAEKTFIGQRMPFTLDIAIMGTAYLCLGYASADIVEWMRSLQTSTLMWLSTLSFSLMIPVTYHNDTFYMYVNEYGNYLLAMLGSLFGILAFCAAVFSVRTLYRPIQWLSNNTLVLYPLHIGIWFFVYTYYNNTYFVHTNSFYTYTTVYGSYMLAVIGSVFGVKMTDLTTVYFDYLHFTVKMAIAIAALIPCVYLINRYIPLLTGKATRNSR